MTAQLVLDQTPSVVQVVPLTSRIHEYRPEVIIGPEPGNGLEAVSAAQCQHIRAIAAGRLTEPVGNVGPQAVTRRARAWPTFATSDEPPDHRSDDWRRARLVVALVMNGGNGTRGTVGACGRPLAEARGAADAGGVAKTINVAVPGGTAAGVYTGKRRTSRWGGC